MPLYVGTHATDCVKVYRGIYPFCKIYQGSTLKWWASDCQACVKYGYLYNWYAAIDTRNIAASGWHLPTWEEWQSLITYVGGSTVAGGKLKETGTTYWDSPNTDATNEFGYYSRGSGWRNLTGVFELINKNATGWCSDEYPDYRYGRITDPGTYNTASAGTVLYDNKQRGRSIRLIKDDSTLATYVGNDGKSYQTVKIGDQVWLAENLAETKYRDGSYISIVEDASTWAGLTSGAMCAYDNDYTNVGCGEVAPIITTIVINLSDKYYQVVSKNLSNEDILIGQIFNIESTVILVNITTEWTVTDQSVNFNVRCSIYTLSGGFPSSKLFDSCNVVSATSENGAIFYFGNELTAGDYAFVFTYEDVVEHSRSNNTMINFPYSQTSIYSDGCIIWKNGSASWANLNSGNSDFYSSIDIM